ncbi:Dihydroorotate dehydrogenase (quinone) [Dirofilaria immitis]
MNMQFRNPIGLAAGFDKDAEAIEGLRKSGFGFIEVGTVTPLPQKNDSNSVVKFLSRDEGCNRLKADYSFSVHYFGPFSNYLVVNFGIQAGLETVTDMEVGITSAVNQIIEINELPPKILIKIPPDLLITDLKTAIKILLNKQYNINGIIISNSITSHPKNLQTVLQEDGFLSGRPLRDLSTDCIRNVYSLSCGKISISLSCGKISIIGCGGISSDQDAYEKIRAGASLLQLYSSLLYQDTNRHILRHFI